MDILAHPNVVLFISHGGMFSNLETVYNGVQMLVIPFISDQFRNAQLIENRGYGKQMNFNDLTQTSLLRTLDEMLSGEKYSNRAKEVSGIFRDNVVQPMDEFIWWIEHVIKFRGAKYLKSHAADMSLFTYLLIDVALVNLAILIATIFSIKFVIKRIFSKKKGVNRKVKKE